MRKSALTTGTWKPPCTGTGVAWTTGSTAPTTLRIPLRRATPSAPGSPYPDRDAYWYHPHIRQDYGQEMGLDGTIIVEPTDPDY